ncbi:MAG: DUF6850 family outer membrane beta-barrel protein [Bacteroidales bacterium]
MKKIEILASLLFCMGATLLKAQDTKVEKPLSNQEREIKISSMSWGGSNNAAGLALEEYNQHGQSEVSGYLSGGDLHRSQEGDAINGIRFKTDRYDRITPRFIVWGSFQFDMNRETNRAWSDVIDTYGGTPYIFGSAIPADYDSQFFDFKAKIAHHTTDKLKLGASIDYLVGDVSRLRDPRSRSYLADYSIAPAITYTFTNRFTLGALVSYRYRKEKMPNVKTEQEDPNFNYYPMVGLENGEEPRLNPGAENGNGILRGFNAFRRQFVSDFWGGEIQASYMIGAVKWISSLGYEIENQEVLGDTRRSPGEYLSDRLNISSRVIADRGDYSHLASIEASLYSAQANEFIQSLNEIRDPATGITSKEWITNFVYKNQYEVDKMDLDLSYRLNKLDNNRSGYRWYAGAEVNYSAFENKYNVPLSYLKVGNLSTSLSAGVRIFKRDRHTVTAEALIGYKWSTKSDLLLNNYDNDLAKNIWIPDSEFYSVNQINLKANLNYNFPIATSKLSMSGYIRIFTDNRLSDSSRYGNWISNGIAFGVITL